jgi:hypothetical protein
LVQSGREISPLRQARELLFSLRVPKGARGRVDPIDEKIKAALTALAEKPDDSASREDKKAYSEALSYRLAAAFGAELRDRGLVGARPTEPGELDVSGAERRMAGGIGAKRVDVTWATEESGLLLGLSIKTINFRDKRSKNFQKNLINRRGDMLMEGVTLHRRFPYAVLAGFFFFDKDAEHDGTSKRASTFANAHTRLRIFAGRVDPAGRDEQFERMYLILVDAAAAEGYMRAFSVGQPDNQLSMKSIFDDILQVLADRNSDFYECVDGKLTKVPS